jgi:PEP-CTERM motif-containing protein
VNKIEAICKDAKWIALRQCGCVVFLLAVLVSSPVARADSMSYQFTLDRTTQVGPGSYDLQETSFVIRPVPHAVLSGFPGVFLQYGNVDTFQLEFVDGVLIHESTELDVVTFGAPNGIPFSPTPTGNIALATDGAVYFTMTTASPLWTGDPFSNPMFLPGLYDDPNQPGSDLEIEVATPEPSSVVLLGTGMVAVMGAIRRRLKTHAGL